jgi:hypothetical protein
MKAFRFVLWVFLIFWQGHALFATHIVGGEFQLAWTGRGYLYSLTMNMYFDDINAADGLLEDDIVIFAGIFEKGTDNFIRTVELPRISQDFIPNSEVNCADESVVRTRLLRYNALVNLNGLTNPSGYYVIWERCCRNEIIDNIINPDDVGLAFYLEFPPSTIINSTPRFDPLDNQFWCTNNINTFDFSGVDFNGDSLVYSLVTPLAGNTSLGLVSPNPPLSGPYAPITWEFGYSEAIQITGSLPLRIDSETGILQFNPDLTGLYVFGVLVEEFRDGVKLGEVHRDFQLYVINCPSNLTPKLSADANFSDVTTTLTVPLGSTPTVFDLFVTDGTAALSGIPESVVISIYKTDLPESVISFPSLIELNAVLDTVSFPITFSPCNQLFIDQNKSYTLELVARDLRCPPKTDTLRLTINVIIPPDNEIPELFSDPSASTQGFRIGEQGRILIYGTDGNPADLLYLSGQGLGFDWTAEGMQFQNVGDSTSTISSPFSWRPDCDQLGKGPYTLEFILRDNSCIFSNRDTLQLEVYAEDKPTIIQEILPPNLVTPNKDGKNEVFFIPNIPDGNCEFFFKEVEIYNQWGSRVFYDTRPNFVWDPSSNSDGIYFYRIDLNKATKSGWIHVLGN